MPDGSRSVQALFQLSTGTVQLQVTVSSGPDIAAKLGAGVGQIAIWPASASASESLDPATLAKLEASKMAMASAAAASDSSASAIGKAAPSSPEPSLDASALASLQAQKQAMASAQATESPAPGDRGSRLKPSSDESCSQVASDENACVSHLTKDSLSVVDVQLLRTGSAPLMVDVAASNGKDVSVPATGQLPSDATMTALAQAVAAHF